MTSKDPGGLPIRKSNRSSSSSRSSMSRSRSSGGSLGNRQKLRSEDEDSERRAYKGHRRELKRVGGSCSQEKTLPKNNLHRRRSNSQSSSGERSPRRKPSRSPRGDMISRNVESVSRKLGEESIEDKMDRYVKAAERERPRSLSLGSNSSGGKSPLPPPKKYYSKSRSPSIDKRRSERESERKSYSKPKLSRERSRSRDRRHDYRHHSKERRRYRKSCSRSRSRSPRRHSHRDRYRHRRSRSRDRYHDRSSRRRRSRSKSGSRSRRSRSRDKRRRSRSYDRHSHSRHHRSTSRDRRRRRRRSHSSSRSRSRSHGSSRERLKSKAGPATTSITTTMVGSLPLSTTASTMTPQVALQQTMAAMSAKAQALTGIELPKYYNPAAVNPLKYAEQVQKRKLLWQKEEKQEEQPKNSVWDKLTFAQDQDGKMTAKFRKLMGIKSEGVAETVSKGEIVEKPSDVAALEKQEELFRNLDQQYEAARMSTHTHRGVGLGYSAQAIFPPIQRPT